MSISHRCIKCGSNYFDEEVDDYYCEPCNETRLAIAKEVDAKIAMKGTTRKSKSGLQLYDDIRAMRRTNFVNIKDLGITL